MVKNILRRHDQRPQRSALKKAIIRYHQQWCGQGQVAESRVTCKRITQRDRLFDNNTNPPLQRIIYVRRLTVKRIVIYESDRPIIWVAHTNAHTHTLIIRSALWVTTFITAVMVVNILRWYSQRPQRSALRKSVVWYPQQWGGQGQVAESRVTCKREIQKQNSSDKLFDDSTNPPLRKII